MEWRIHTPCHAKVFLKWRLSDWGHFGLLPKIGQNLVPVGLLRNLPFALLWLGCTLYRNAVSKPRKLVSKSYFSCWELLHNLLLSSFSWVIGPTLTSVALNTLWRSHACLRDPTPTSKVSTEAAGTSVGWLKISPRDLPAPGCPKLSPFTRALVVLSISRKWNVVCTCDETLEIYLGWSKLWPKERVDF